MVNAAVKSPRRSNKLVAIGSEDDAIDQRIDGLVCDADEIS